MVSKPDQIFPIFVMQVMGDIPCVPGLFVAGVFSGALSTVSSGLNSLAAVVLQDMFISACDMKFDEKKKTIITKSLAVGFGIISYVFVFMVKYLPGVLEVHKWYLQSTYKSHLHWCVLCTNLCLNFYLQAALGIFGIVGGPVLGGFTLGMFIPWANSLVIIKQWLSFH